LLPTDPALKEALRELAVAEENRGGMEAAAKAHLASGRPSAAVRAMLRPRDALGSVAAAEVALIARVRTEPDKQTVLRAARELSDAGRRDDAEGMLRRWVEGGDGDGDGDADVEEVRRAIVAARRGASGAVEGTEPRAAES
jgi:gem associated protein 5